MNAPDWNPQDKPASLKGWVDMLLAETRRQFLSDGTHIEIFFLFNDDGLMNLAPISGMEKEEIIAGLKQTLRANDGYAYIHIVEAHTRAIDCAAEADSLLLIAESRDGYSKAILNTVVMKGDEKCLVDPVEIDESQLDGCFIGMFT